MNSLVVKDCLSCLPWVCHCKPMWPSVPNDVVSVCIFDDGLHLILFSGTRKSFVVEVPTNRAGLDVCHMFFFLGKVRHQDWSFSYIHTNPSSRPPWRIAAFCGASVQGAPSGVLSGRALRGSSWNNFGRLQAQLTSACQPDAAQTGSCTWCVHSLSPHQHRQSYPLTAWAPSTMCPQGAYSTSLWPSDPYWGCQRLVWETYFDVSHIARRVLLQITPAGRVEFDPWIAPSFECRRTL